MEVKAIILGTIVLVMIAILVGSFFWITRNDKNKPSKNGGGTSGTGEAPSKPLE